LYLIHYLTWKRRFGSYVLSLFSSKRNNMKHNRASEN